MIKRVTKERDIDESQELIGPEIFLVPLSRHFQSISRPFINLLSNLSTYLVWVQFKTIFIGYPGETHIPVNTWAIPTSTSFGTFNVPTSNFGPIGQPVPNRVIPTLVRAGNPRLKLKPKPIGPRLIKATEIKVGFKVFTQKRIFYCSLSNEKKNTFLTEKFSGEISETNKAWLFEWCTQKKLKPTYSFESKGKYPKVKYICTLAIDGIEYRAISEARNKKDAQVNTSGVRELIFFPSPLNRPESCDF